MPNSGKPELGWERVRYFYFTSAAIFAETGDLHIGAGLDSALAYAKARILPHNGAVVWTFTANLSKDHTMRSFAAACGHRYRRLLRRFLRKPIERSFNHPDARFYVYFPSSNRLSPLLEWNRFVEAVLTGDVEHIGRANRMAEWRHALERLDYDGGIVFDVGVSYGYTSAWFASRAARVFCFEPNPRNQKFIAEHIMIRGLANVELIAKAVGAYDGTAKLHVKPRDEHHSLGDIGASPTIGRIEVPIVTLDSFAAGMGIERIALAKVDVEGFEPEVFSGARGLLGRRAIGAILFEYSPQFYRQRGIDPLEPARILASFGYRFENIDGCRLALAEITGDQQRDLIALPG